MPHKTQRNNYNNEYNNEKNIEIINVGSNPGLKVFEMGSNVLIRKS